jgi:probable HAF family extracellular repeat protein
MFSNAKLFLSGDLCVAVGASGILIAACLATPKVCAGQNPTSTYAVVPLPLATLEDYGSSTVVRRVNSLDEVVGSYKVNNQKTAASFILSTSAIDDVTSDQPTDNSALYGINDGGEVAGAINGSSTLLPFRAIRHRGFQILTLLPGDTGGAALAMNEQGEAAGYSSGGSGVRAVWWTRKGEVQELRSLPNDNTAQALHLNKFGDVVGTSGEIVKRAVLWPTKGTPIQLETPQGFTDVEAVSISDRGEIAGFASVFVPRAVQTHAVVWGQGGQTLTDLGTLPGGLTSRARDVAENGEVVGTSSTSDGNHAFLWSAARGMLDLNTLVTDQTLILIDAVSISKKGVIAAIAVDANAIPPGQSLHVEEHELPRRIVLLIPTK